MILENSNCIIEINIDETFTVDSTDNHYYDIIHNPCQYKHSDFAKTLAIHVDLFSKEYSIALVGSFYTYDSNCAILENDTIIVLQTKNEPGNAVNSAFPGSCTALAMLSPIPLTLHFAVRLSPYKDKITVFKI